MLKSMTGFGRGKVLSDGREMTVELRSVNHKTLDIAFRMPRTLNFLEDVFRTEISAVLARGHIDVSVTYKNTRDDAKSVQVDTTVFEQYLNTCNTLAEKHSLRNDLSVTALLRMPEVVTVTENDEDTDAVTVIAKEAVKQALSSLCAMREKEGEHLYSDIHTKLNTLSDIRNELEKRADGSAEEQKEKLREKVAALMPQGMETDSQLIATEIGILANKLCVDEELVRIRTHISNMRDMLSVDEPIGRKLDFLVQEINRELNTTGSKSTDVAISQLVISGKAEIEKIREQIQNIE